VLTSAVPAPLRAPDPLSFVTVPVPAPAPPAWCLPDLRVWWAPRGGGEIACLGLAAEVSARGADRLAELRRRAAELFARVIVHDAPDAPPFSPRLLGGFAFAPGAADAPPWRELGDAWFALPRAYYRREGERAWLTVVAAGSRGAALDQASRAAERLVRTAPRAAPGAPPPVTAVHQQDRASWRAGVEEIRRAIAAGACEKIVHARRAELELAAPPDPVALLGRLDARHPDCFRFAVRAGGAMFVGASPERLVSVRGDVVETEAMAGSMGGGGGAARALLDSRKDRGEQAVVARAIARALAPLATSLELAPVPEVRELRHVVHLCTPVRARLERPRHLLELAAALHPTPAVGGEPGERAVEWIARHERAPRGWYAGAVGWFDAAGDGELAVAIRSGLVAGSRAWLWAGAGIVAESDPDAEYAETGLKQRALLDVLGAPPDGEAAG